jgi:hypothetical protein
MNKIKEKHTHKHKQKQKHTHKNTQNKYTKKYNNIKYDKNYFIDQRFFIDKTYYINKIIKYLKSCGLKEDPMMNIIKKSDMLYLKKHNIKFDPKEFLLATTTSKNKINNIDTLKPTVLLQYYNLFDKRLYNIPCVLTNILNIETLIELNKSNLYLNLEKYYPKILNKHMSKTFYINEINNYKFPKMYILRPIKSFGGKDILYISNKEELDKAIDYYNTTNFYYERDKIYHGNNVIASEYIMNPLLYKNKKFHLRMYYLLTYVNNHFNTFFIDIGKITTSLNDYNIDKPFLPEIHDTHFKYTKEDTIFSYDIKNSNFNKNIDATDIIKQMRTILKYTTKMLTKTITINKETLLYDNQDHGYLLTGVDFMIDDTGNVFLIEINRIPGITFNTEIEGSKMFDIIYKLIDDVVFQPLFKKNNINQSQKLITAHPFYLHIGDI